MDKLELKETLVDRAVSYVSPIRGAKRRKARVFLAMTNTFVGARKDRRQTKNWKVTRGDADADMRFDRQDLVDRSADLYKNVPLATGAINTTVTNVIGTGLKLNSKIDFKYLGKTKEDAKEWQESTEREFEIWAESPESDVARTLNFYDRQELSFRQVLECGDVFTIFPRIKSNNSYYSLRMQTVEADRVCNENNRVDGDLDDGGRLFQGVEKDRNGAPVRYHICSRHPGSYSTAEKKWDKVEAFGKKTGQRNVIHLFHMLRPDQSRGLPFLSPVIETLKMLGNYTEAELMAAVISGMYTVFITSETGDDQPKAPTITSTDDDIRLDYGAVVSLKPDEKITTANPGRPNTAFDLFITSILRQVGVALGIPYEVLILHFTSSYSASKAALLEAWRFFKNRRRWMALNFCQVVYELWLAEAIARGRIAAPGYFSDIRIRHAYNNAQWVGDAPGQLDPTREMSAVRERIELGISTIERETAELTGEDWADNKEQIRDEREFFASVGMPLSKQTVTTINQQQGDD